MISRNCQWFFVFILAFIALQANAENPAKNFSTEGAVLEAAYLFIAP
jgi:hypothetical protein